MWNKIVIAGLMTVLIGGLTIGAVNRTTDWLDKNTEGSRPGEKLVQENAGQDHGRGRAGTKEAAQTGNRSGAQLDSGSRIQSNPQNQMDGQCGEGQVGNESTGAPTAEAKDRLSISGTVISVGEAEMIVELIGGEHIVVDGRAWSFSQELGFVVELGDQIRLDGFFENEDFEVGAMENITTGVDAVVLREESGRPLWAGPGGRGRREA